MKDCCKEVSEELKNEISKLKQEKESLQKECDEKGKAFEELMKSIQFSQTVFEIEKKKIGEKHAAMENQYKELIKSYEGETKRLQGEVTQLLEMIDELGGSGDNEKIKKQLKEKDAEISFLKLQIKKKEIETIKLNAQKEMLMHAYL